MNSIHKYLQGGLWLTLLCSLVIWFFGSQTLMVSASTFLTPLSPSLPVSTSTPPTKPSPIVQTTPTFAPLATTPERVDFFLPLDGSTIDSPIQVQACLNLEQTYSYRLELIRQDGRLLARKVYLRNHESLSNLSTPAPKQKGWVCQQGQTLFSTILDFGLEADNVKARIKLLLNDKNGKIRALSSLDLVLSNAPTIESSIVPSRAADRLSIEKPAPGSSVEGGRFPLQGYAFGTNILPLRAELILPDGESAGSRMVMVPGAQTKYNQFSELLPYHVKTKTPALLILTEFGEDIQGVKTIITREIFLNP